MTDTVDAPAQSPSSQSSATDAAGVALGDAGAPANAPANALANGPVTASVTADSRVYLVDGSAYIFRAYHALPPLTRKSDGLPVGAVSGFCNMIFKLLQDFGPEDAPTHLAVIFDHPSRTFRDEIYSEYKANRPPAPEDLVPQFPLVRDATRAFNVACVEMAGFEADDLIATYARQAEAAGAEVVIVSSDKDLMQLVSDRVILFDQMKDKRIGPDGVREKFGVGPERMIELQALIGDTSDNVPGVPGIGPKTAAQLLEDFGSLDAVLERAGEITAKKRRENLINHADDARMSKQLVTLRTDVPVEHSLDRFAVAAPDPDVVLPFLKGMEFRTITRRVEEAISGVGTAAGGTNKAAGGNASANVDPNHVDRAQYECVTNLDALQTWIDRATAAGVVAVDTETDALSASAAGLVGVCLAVGNNEACYIPIGHVGEGGGDLLDPAGAPPEQIPFDDAIAALKPLLEDPSVLKVGQNLKYDIAVLSRYGVCLHPIDDTMLLSYVLDAGLHGHGMDELSERHFDHRPIAFKQVAGSGKSQISFAKVPLDRATEYAAEDADITLRLWRTLKPQLTEKKLHTVYERLERPMPGVLAQMELNGIKVDVATLKRLSGDFAQRAAGLEAQAHEQAGREFNLGSPKQLGEILFGELSLPGGKKTKTGAWSTDAKVLEELANQGHDLPQTIMAWRQLTKLKSTYTDALVGAINPATGRVHTSFSLAATTTGRLSSSDPNLQNIPIRTEEGRKIREAFVPERGHVLVAADYSQIELRLLAHYAEIPSLRQAFVDGQDIHAMTASEMFGVPIEGMDPMVRRQAKAINFGIIYGISAFGLANNLGIGREEAGAYIKSYFEKFPGIKDYMERMKAIAREKGYVETLFGRRCHYPDINTKNPNMRGFAERQAINAPLQGTAADIIRRAMARMPGALKQAGLQARMLLQVHDELVFECPQEETEKLCALAKDVMETATRPVLDLSVPLVVEAGFGQTWGQAH